MGVIITGKNLKIDAAESSKCLFASFHLTRNPEDLKRKIMVYGAYYSFTKANAPEWLDKYDESLITSVRIPRIYRDKFAYPPICESHISRQIGNVGYIEYRFLIDGKRIVATTNEYDPKRWTPSDARGLGYFIEIITAHDLEKLGVTHITTTKYPDHTRCRQLKSVGLPINEEVPIKEWMLGLAKGVKFWSEKLSDVS